MLNRKFGLAVVGLLAIGLFIPQFSAAQVPDISGSWSGSLVVNNPSQNISSTASLSSSSSSVSGSVTTNNSQLASSSVATSSESSSTGSSMMMTCDTCISATATTEMTLEFNGFTVQISGTLDGSDFANGSFSATDSSGNTINGSANGSISGSSVSLSFSGTNNLGQAQNGTLNATNSTPPDNGCNVSDGGPQRAICYSVE